MQDENVVFVMREPYIIPVIQPQRDDKLLLKIVSVGFHLLLTGLMIAAAVLTFTERLAWPTVVAELTVAIMHAHGFAIAIKVLRGFKAALTSYLCYMLIACLAAAHLTVDIAANYEVQLAIAGAQAAIGLPMFLFGVALVLRTIG